MCFGYVQIFKKGRRPSIKKCYFFHHPKCGNSDHETGFKFGICTSDLWEITSRICTFEMSRVPACPTCLSEKTASKIITDKIKSKFGRFYLVEISKHKLDSEGVNRNKLRFYSTIKGCFRPEYYIDIHNRNQSTWLSRLHTSSHRLEVETGRYQSVPLADRQCQYCSVFPCLWGPIL